MPLARIRIKSQWFRPGAVKTPQQTASAMAFITWRVAQNTLKQMRSADFDIDIGPQYFAFTREMLVFLIQIIDRLAHERMTTEQRREFISALVCRVAEILQENEDTLLGLPQSPHASHFDQFIDLFNQLAEHYGEFGHNASGPDFAFVRYLGHRIEQLMPAKDRRWVIEQMMAIEVPPAIEMIRRALSDVLSTEPRRAARTTSTGD